MQRLTIELIFLGKGTGEVRLDFLCVEGRWEGVRCGGGRKGALLTGTGFWSRASVEININTM